MERKNLIENGVHYLSGIGHTEYRDEWSDDIVEAYLFCIDGTTYAAYIDHNDGYRSYGRIEPTNAKCQFNFEPQKVVITNNTIQQENEYGDYEDAVWLTMEDPILRKEVLAIGTDYTDSYYPLAIFRYNPMNLYVNVERSIREN